MKKCKNDLTSSNFFSASKNGEKKESEYHIHADLIKNFLFDIYNVRPVVYEEFTLLLQDLNLLEIRADEDGLMKLMVVTDLIVYQQLTNFLES